jgi:UDP-N-acetylglucosamine--N-acetylmuramyl-(pentapeptide) pyrophosphoryl-undecaprenol N-acetylglucosamine transferase
MNLVITGGGTGGHIFAGVAIAEEFLRQSKANKVLFVGSAYGLETRLVPKAGYDLETLNLGKLVGQPWYVRIFTLIQIPIAIIRCLCILRKFRAQMVIGVGGYAAGPCILAARILGIPSGVLEQNAIMGFTNRISAKLANQVFTAFPKVPSGVESAKCVVSGNPTRSNLKPALAKPVKPFVVFVFGGSQGASGLNTIVSGALEILDKRGRTVSVVHQTGERDFDAIRKKYTELGLNAEVHRFIDDMQSRYNQASLVVCRAGSSTISELGATQNASILVPYPHAAGNHQEFNAKTVVNAGAALLVLESEPNAAQVMAAKIEALMDSPDQLDKMRRAAGGFFQPGAAGKIIETMKAHALLA